MKLVCMMMLALAAVLVSADEGFDDNPSKLSVVRGKQAVLQCGEVRSVNVDDTVTWYRDDNPIASLNPAENPGEAALVLEEVDVIDTGIYRCRINKNDGPSKDYIIKLEVIDFHGTPVIINDKNNTRIDPGRLGPFKEGDALSLRCEVEDSDPKTQVRWYRNGKPYAWGHRAEQGYCCAEIMIQNMTRSDQGVLYECVALSQNANKTAGFTVKMALPPLNVSIRTDNNDDFEVGTPRVLACVVYGCVPSPNVTWYLGENMLRPNVYKEVNEGNFTVSSLTYVPCLSDNGKELVCKATNEYIPGIFEDRVTVSVGHRPVCIDNSFITIGAVEGENETMVCVVEASPQPEQFIWTFADSSAIYTSSKKVPGYENRYSSTLNWIPRSDDFGPLDCHASNRFGEQKQPCVFSVVKGGPPTTPECEMFWQDEGTLRVMCEENWDGGRPQTIHAEVKTAEGTRTVSRSSHQLDIDWLRQGANVTVEVHATNSRGSSGSTLLTLPPTSYQDEEQESDANSSEEMGLATKILATLFGALLLMSCSGLAIFVAYHLRPVNYTPPNMITECSFRRETDIDETVTSALSIDMNNRVTSQKTVCRKAATNTYKNTPFQNAECDLMLQCPDCVDDHYPRCVDDYFSDTMVESCVTTNKQLPSIDTTGTTYYCV